MASAEGQRGTVEGRGWGMRSVRASFDGDGGVGRRKGAAEGMRSVRVSFDGEDGAELWARRFLMEERKIWR